MGLYDGIKDVANVLRKADNVELYQQLIELSAQALEMQNEIHRLTNENIDLKKAKEIESRIERHDEPFVTLRDDDVKIIYCARCWDYDRKLIQVRCYDSGEFKCMNCKNAGIHDKEKHKNSRISTASIFL